jgi:hypothetical protein
MKNSLRNKVVTGMLAALFAANNPFYIVNIEKGYKADYDLCDKISRLYYGMLDHLLSNT